jgi:hypothetical protein
MFHECLALSEGHPHGKAQEWLLPPKPEKQVEAMLMAAIGEAPDFLLEWFSLHDGFNWTFEHVDYSPMLWSFGAEVLLGVVDSLADTSKYQERFNRLPARCVHFAASSQMGTIAIGLDVHDVVISGQRPGPHPGTVNGAFIAPTLLEYLQLWRDIFAECTPTETGAVYVSRRHQRPTRVSFVNMANWEVSDQDVGREDPPDLPLNLFRTPPGPIQGPRDALTADDYKRLTNGFRIGRPFNGHPAKPRPKISQDFEPFRPAPGDRFIKHHSPTEPAGW